MIVQTMTLMKFVLLVLMELVLEIVNDKQMIQMEKKMIPVA
jgi:hypothetical protein